MLTCLHIENMAIFAAADIEFGDGLNVLTGETGAGKSIVLDALGLALGARAQKELVRTGTPKALVTALFTQLPAAIDDWMAENGMEGCPDGELLLLRELYADGRSACRVNGRPQTAAMLKALGQMLLSVHGQHDTYQLLRPENHLHYIDKFAANAAERKAYDAAYQAWHALCRERDGLQLNEADKQSRLELLRFHVEDLGRLAPRDGEEAELYERRKLLRSAGKLSDAAALLRGLLKGDDEADGACTQLARAAETMASVAGLGDEWATAAERLNALHDEAYDACESALDLFGDVEFSENELELIESRLDALSRAAQRHGVTVEALPQLCARLQAELDALDFADMRLAELERALTAAEASLRLAAQALTDSRLAAAQALKQRVEGELKDLDMGAVAFTAQLVDAGGYHADGCESACFMLSTNPGEPEKPLSKIASGGELARIMLALQNVLSDVDVVSTLVFDEVDTGVSGRAAQRVAEKLAAVAKQKQVLCVTHLPQVAAFADTHLRVEKDVTGDRADTRVLVLDEDARVGELGRLLGADSAGESALHNAKALLAQAEKGKASG